MSDTFSKWLVIVLVILLLLTSCGGTNQSSKQQTKLPLEDCDLEMEGVARRLSARCGKLSVPEDPQNPTGRKIDLNLAVLPASGRKIQADPLFFLTGGPGQAATQSYLAISAAFSLINQERDIVLVDQRGTGKSNPLSCPDRTDSNDPAKIKAVLSECLAQIQGDPRQYTTTNAVTDIDKVRQALGYDLINLYGVSYGTRVAQTYLKTYPEHVRAVILDGVVPQDLALGSQVAPAAQRALDIAFQRCSQEAGCQKNFPDIDVEWQSLLEELSSQPKDTFTSHPVTGEVVDLDFDRERLASTVRLLLYTPETTALLPLLLHAASSSGDLHLLAAQYLLVSGDLEGNISQGMQFSVLCSEDFPYLDLAAARQAAEATFLGASEIEQLETVCSVWPHDKAPASFKNPVRSDAPVLLLSGEADPATPPENAERAASYLPNSLNLIASGQGHNVILRGCLPKVAADFISAGSLQGLETNCVADIRPIPFFIDFSGPGS